MRRLFLPMLLNLPLFLASVCGPRGRTEDSGDRSTHRWGQVRNLWRIGPGWKRHRSDADKAGSDKVNADQSLRPKTGACPTSMAIIPERVG